MSWLPVVRWGRRKAERDVESFETYRTYLFAIAYRMLGSAMEAEDMVQDTWVRYQATPPATIRSLKAFLTTICTRLCLDQLQLARRKRELYVGPWLPEPIVTGEPSAPVDPEQRIEREESIALAFLVLLEQLQPVERAVLLLREVFGYEFAEIAQILGKGEATCRRSFSRAKQHLHAHRPRFTASRETQQQLLSGFIRAVEQGDLQTLVQLLAEDVTLWTDAGGNRKQAALHPIRGREAVTRFSVGTLRFVPQYHAELREINGQAAMIIRAAGEVFSVLTVDVAAGRIATIYVLANPEKLTRVA